MTNLIQAPGTVRELLKSLSRNYRNQCPRFTEIAVREFVKPATSAQEARASLAADLCVERFLAAPDVRTNLAALAEESSFSQDNFISDAGWTTFANAEDPVDGAAELCAERLIEVELPEPVEPVAVEADASMQSEMPDTEENPS